jgi:predicted nucleic acid-binding Zn ribbon protein
MTTSNITQRQPKYLCAMEPGWCKVCDKRLPDVRNTRRVVCSFKCDKIVQRAKRSKALAAVRASLKCIMCEAPLVNAARSDTKTCGKQCKALLLSHQKKAKRKVVLDALIKAAFPG